MSELTSSGSATTSGLGRTTEADQPRGMQNRHSRAAEHASLQPRDEPNRRSNQAARGTNRQPDDIGNIASWLVTAEGTTVLLLYGGEVSRRAEFDMDAHYRGKGR